MKKFSLKMLTARAKVAFAMSLVMLITSISGLGFAIGALSKYINIGGDIRFSAQNADVSISEGTIAGGTITSGSDKMQEVDLNSANSSAVQSWQDIDFQLDDGATQASMGFVLTSTTTDTNLAVGVSEVSGDFNNVSYTITINGKETTSIVLSGDSSSSTTTSNFDTAESVISAEVVITFTVIDENYKASVKNFTFPFYFIPTSQDPDFVYELTEDGKGVYFGEWPQTLAEPGITFSAFPDRDGYYVGSDGERYAKYTIDWSDLEEFGLDSMFTEAGGAMNRTEDGTYLVNEETYYFKIEKLLWDIISTDDNNVATIVCANAIQEQAFQTNIVYDSSDRKYYATDGNGNILTDGNGNKVYANNYEYSALRQFLINDFYNNAFNSLQAELIQQIEVDNSAASTESSTNPYACENTQDKIWALSYAEIMALADNSKFSVVDLFKPNTDYAKAMGAATYTQEFCATQGYTAYAILTNYFNQEGVAEDATYGTVTAEQQSLLDLFYASGVWWLRSPYSSDSLGAFVVYYGTIDYDFVSRPFFGVVPALKMKLGIANSDMFSYSLTEDGTGIYFGEWPQTIAEEGVTFSANRDKDGYYLGSDGERYAKIKVNWSNKSDYDLETFWTEEGCGMNLVSDGTYLQEGSTYYFKVEKLRWKILERDGDIATVICTSIIEGMEYQENYKRDSGDNCYYVITETGEYMTDAEGNRIYANNYEYSMLRQFLINEFYNKAFNDLQKELIQTVLVDNSGSTDRYPTNPFGGNDTLDKVWVLSEAEYYDRYIFDLDEEGFSYDSDDFLFPTTDYSKAIGVETHTRKYGEYIDELWGEDDFGTHVYHYGVGVHRNDTYDTLTPEGQAIMDKIYAAGDWWSRTPHNDTYNGTYSGNSVSVYEAGLVVSAPMFHTSAARSIGVVPALKIDLSYPASDAPEVEEDEEDAIAPGLYNSDTDELMLSWTELLEEGYIDVTDGVLTGNNPDMSGKLVIADTVTTISAEAFYSKSDSRGYDYLTNVVFPDSVTEIGEIAFLTCLNLTSVTFGNGLATIGSHAFAYCIGLTSINIPKSVTSIGESVFSDCLAITSLTVNSENSTYHSKNNCIIETNTNTLIQGCKTSIIPNYVTVIGEAAFSGCIGLTSITIPDSITTISNSAFESCESLTSITIPNSVISIDDFAFHDCSGLTNATIGSGVNRIGEGVFSDCPAITSLTVNSENSTYHSKNNCIIETNTNTLIQGCKTSIIPNYVTSIGNYAFYGCGLTSITIPNSVTSIGDYAFYDCESLTSITIPDSVTSIGSHAFAYCNEVTSVTIGSGVKTIGDYAFIGCHNLTSITIPDSVTSIGDNAFSSCRSLTSITIPDSITTISNYAFSDCSSLTSITIPDSVTSIGSGAFNGCSELISVTIGSAVTSIGQYAFAGCGGLVKVTIGSGVTSIGSYAFSDCTMLTSMFIPNSVTTISTSPFNNCTQLLRIYCEATEAPSGWVARWNVYSGASELLTYYGCTRDSAGNIYDSSGTLVVPAPK